MQKFWQLWDRYRPWLQRFRWWLLAGGILVAILTLTLIHAVSRPAAPSQVPRLAAEMTSQVSSTKASSSSGKTAGGKQWVDIKGAVARPGLYAFKEGDRVKQGIDLAGGLTPKADTVRLNLAQPLVDGQVVYILSQGEATSPVGGQAGAAANAAGDSGGTSGPVNLNTATSEQLQTLDGVGAKRAEKIIAYRQEHGRFNQASDLCQVDGIGDKFFQKIKDQVTV
ncbi:helix-hairpin-helix domain-containing protein [Leuconostocaceae bacterium ESL0723]|nr:helix-hairpin-helix domain-containing protein [Leuconostocaceae bacterium ESL0723]